MVYLANAAGVLAILLFVLCFQFKKRPAIILCNIASRVFYVLQYLLLGAWSGAALDFLAALISAAVTDKNRHKKLKTVIVALLYAVVVAVSILLYQNVFSLLAFIGVSFEIGSMLFTKERHIRIFSLISQPFWLVYNGYHLAWSSAAGNVFTIISIVVSLIRYRKDK